MAVLVEAYSVIVRKDAIDRAFAGGWDEFLASVPNGTFCSDGELARVGFMAPEDVDQFLGVLRIGGLAFMVDGKAQDIALADQRRGVVTPCDWLEFARLPIGEGDATVGACWLFEEPRTLHGVHIRGDSIQLALPAEWTYEESLSKDSEYSAPNERAERLKFLRHEDGTDIYLDLDTGRELYTGRTGKGGE